MPPNVAFGPSPVGTSKRSPSPGRKRRYAAVVAMAGLLIAAFVAGSWVAATTATSAVAANPIQSAVLPVADDGVDDTEPEPETGLVGESSCHPAYVDCVPLDLAEDLDCEDLAITDVRLYDVGWDPYELDGNGDGLGCESG